MGSLRDELAELLGPTALRRLIDHAGGRRAYVPRRIRDNSHWMAVMLGREAADALALRYGGCRLDIPRHPPPDSRNERIRELRRAGWSSADIAGRIGLSERQVRRITAKDRQGEDWI